MSAPDPELAHLEDAINELAAQVSDRFVQIASSNGDLTGSIKVALDSLRSGNAMKAQTILQDALDRSAAIQTGDA